MYSIYLYEEDNGELEMVLVKVIKGVDEMLAKPMAMDYHFMEGYAVKIVDEFDGAVTYTLG